MPESAAMKGRSNNELINPAGALDGLPRYRRLLIGLGAAISGFVAGLCGSAIFYVTLAARKPVSPWISSALAISLLVVALFMILVWWRLWFGPRAWLDRMINRMFLRTYFSLVWVILLLMAFGPVKMAQNP